MFDRNRLLTTTMIAGFGAFSLASAAVAQDAPATTTTPPAATGENEVEGLVITGSRIRRNEFTSASPVQIVTSEGSTLEGLVDPAQVLQTSTVAAGSAQLNNTFTGFLTNGGPGVNTISVRGLGDQRTLVLMNGRRLPPAGTQGQIGAVDLNILPDLVIERIEILKDGASSIYGSDAIAGVVNVITDDDFDGVRMQADGSKGFENGGEELQLGAMWGKVFDKGRFTIAAQWFHREPLYKRDRDWLDCQNPYVFDPNTGERIDTVDFDTGEFKCFSYTGNISGYIPTNELVGNVGVGGGLVPLGFTFYGSRVPIAVEGPRGAEDANLPGLRFIPLDERNFNTDAEGDTTVISPVDRYTFFADGSYDLAAGVELYGEALITRRESSQNGYQTIFPIVAAEAPCPVNPYNCAGATTAAPGSPARTPGFAGAGFTHLGWLPEARVLSPVFAEQTVDVFRGLGGLRGEFGSTFLSGWTYDAYLSYSASRGDYTQTGLYNDRVQAVTGSDEAGNFIGVCPPGSFAGCTGLNFFTNEILTTGVFPQSYRDLLQFSETGHTDYNQLMFEGQITGDLFELPAGTVGAAFGAVYRYDEIDDQPGDQAVAQNYWGFATAGATKGDDSLMEVFGELELPLLRGMPFVEELTLNVSARYSDYDSYGGDTTWKAGLNYRINNQFRIRATAGTSFRAPALYEQFLNDQTAFLPQASVDPCIRWGESANATIRANCAAELNTDGDQLLPENYTPAAGSAQLLIGGGSELKAETSDAMSIGLIWTPEFADLNVAIDYFEITVNDEVTSLAGAVVGQCYASADFPNSPFCDLFTRELDPLATDYQGITFVDASYRNISSQTTRGIDLTIRYNREIGPGELTVESQWAWTFEDALELFPGSIDNFNGVIGEPAFVADLRAGYEWKDWTFTWSTDFIGKQSNVDYQYGTNCDFSGGIAYAGPAYSAPNCRKNWAEPVAYHHFSVRYEADKWTGVIGVRNLFDETPPFASDPISPDKGLYTYGRLGATTGATQYDYVGRSLFVSLTKDF